MESTSGDHRLPDDASPERYDLTISPDLEARTFSGTVTIALNVHQTSRRLTCNAAELEIDGAWIETDDSRRFDASVELDDEAERVSFDFDEPLLPGPALLTVRFRGSINDKLRGFYASVFTGDDGVEEVIGVTQFEATDARRAFPCWDEPDYKAVFGISIDVDEPHLCVSNGPELRREPLGPGRWRVVFADTIPMSTYLVAWTVGPLVATAPLDVDGVPLRIVHRPGHDHLTAFALEAGAHSLRYLADYYGIVYPGDKLDMVAVPDFAFGAMENLGCVVYRESLLLVDPETATTAELRNVADVVAHELAHMWFGDLVTMEWWNGIWLNEAFATFMEMKTTDAFRPEWDRWLFFGRERSAAFDTDALHATRAIEFPVHSPSDAEAMFDVITYQKGSAVVRMLEQFVGEEAFRAGIRRYLQTHQFGNTQTSDLWDAIEAETGVEVRTMMDSWIFQPGHPLVTLSVAGDEVTLDHERFAFDESAPGTWMVPVSLRRGSSVERILLSEPTTVAVAGDGPVMGNAGGHGFYRVRYDDDAYAAILDGLGTLAPLERFTVVDDALGLLLRGDRSVADSLALVSRLVAVGERSLYAWEQVRALLDVVDRVVPESARDEWDRWRRGVAMPLWDELGPDPRDGEDALTRTLRGVVLDLLARAGHDDARDVSRSVFDAIISGESIEPGLAAGALTAAARLADADRFEAMGRRLRNAPTPQERLRFLHAMSTVTDGELFGRYLELLETDDVRSQDLAFAVRDALGNPHHGPRAWEWTTHQWPRLTERLPFTTMPRMLGGVTVFGDRSLAAAVVAHLEAHPLPGSDRQVAQYLERMWVSVAFRERVGGDVSAALVDALATP